MKGQAKAGLPAWVDYSQRSIIQASSIPFGVYKISDKRSQFIDHAIDDHGLPLQISEFSDAITIGLLPNASVSS